MMRHCLFLVIVLLCTDLNAKAQTNMLSTNPLAEQVMLGNYDPALYAASTVIAAPDSISRGILARVSADSLKAYLHQLRTFQNRNSGSDTISANKGIGAARRWAFEKFSQFSAANENRLIPSYLQFDQMICSTDRHRNIFAVLPGADTSDRSVIIIEAHIDSRCADLCDTACLAEGMEDNGSGTALVLELARVMSRYTYNHTIVFLLTTAEEQGLLGAEAFAAYAANKGIAIKAVLNNDVVGGIICGQTSSPPPCPGINHIDSTHVRLFSSGVFNSPHKQLARYIKLEYQEMILPYASVPMGIHILTPEDRTGRGGDHIPFRMHNFTAMRFTSANEHGDADVSVPGYADRQHTSADILGVDTDNDQILDSFFVDFNYLARNAVINGNAAGMAAISPKTPDFTLTKSGSNVTVSITQQQQYQKYRMAIRTQTNDWDTLYTFTGLSYTVALPDDIYYVSLASVDSRDVESLFSKELTAIISGINDQHPENGTVELLQNKPNPFDEATVIGVLVNKLPNHRSAFITITDVATGKEVRRYPVTLKKGMNELIHEHGYHATGTYIYTLVIDGKAVQSRRMVFIN